MNPSSPAKIASPEKKVSGLFSFRPFARMDRRGWMAVGMITAAGTMLTGAMGLGHVPVFSIAIAGVMGLTLVRGGWRMAREGSIREHAERTLLARLDSAGGGVYGMGAAMTLLVLTALSLANDIRSADGVGEFVRKMSFEWIVGFSGDSIRNAISSALWPLHWYQHQGAMAVIGVAVAACAGNALVSSWRRRREEEAEAAIAE